MTDPIVDAVCAKLQSRSVVGLKKYGTTLADNAATIKEKLVHIQEELMDAANYLEWLLQGKDIGQPMLNTINTGEYSVVPSVFHYMEKENRNLYGVSPAMEAVKMMDDENNRRLKELQEKEMPTPMTIEMEADEGQEALSLIECVIINIKNMYESPPSQGDAFEAIKLLRAALQSPRVPDAMFKKLGFLIKAVDGGTFENDPHYAIIDAAIRTLSSPRVPVIEILDTVLEQAEDDGLWFNAKYASEAYLQQELRRLHAVIERAYAELQKGN